MQNVDTAIDTWRRWGRSALQPAKHGHVENVSSRFIHAPVFRGNRTVAQMLKKFRPFYSTRRFISVFTRFRHWSTSWARWFRSTPSHPIPLWSVIIFSSHLRLDLLNKIMFSGFHIKVLCVFLISPMYAICLNHLTVVLNTQIYFIKRSIMKLLNLWSSDQTSWLQILRSWVPFPALPDFLRSSGSGTGSTQPREYNWWATWME
jgi:hypothetical protein